jgi:hypothetical protein
MNSVRIAVGTSTIPIDVFPVVLSLCRQMPDLYFKLDHERILFKILFIIIQSHDAVYSAVLTASLSKLQVNKTVSKDLHNLLIRR